ncbi:MAG: hypothetical protein ACRDYA_10815 [Egibacteraceae bacterium]
MTTEQIDTGRAVFSADQVMCWTPCHGRVTCLDRVEVDEAPKLPCLVECDRCHAYWLVRFDRSAPGADARAVWAHPDW